MSSNSWLRIFATAPIVSALRGRDGESLGGRRCSASLRPLAPSSVAAIAMSALQVAQLVLADLDLVTVLEAVGLDPAAVYVGPVQRAQVVDVEAVLPPDDQRVVARDGDVVQKHRRIGGAPNAHAVTVDGEALARPSAAGADDERGTGLVDLLLDVDRLVLAGLADLVGHRRGVVALRARQVRAALLAVVGSLRIDEAALRAMQRQLTLPPPARARPGRRGCRSTAARPPR